MKVWLFFLFCFSLTAVIAQDDQAALEKKLSALPNVSYKKVSTPSAPYLKYALTIRQPLDHTHPEKGYFYQHVTLLHKGFNRTTVIETQGYWLDTSRNEVEKMLDANDLNVEYRFYGRSIPHPLPWKYLTIEQATADLHAINQLFRKIYSAKWVSTGISKGGETTLYYRYFYPTDVDLSLPYVAPLDNALEDVRLYHFFDTAGTADCRAKIFRAQVFLLEHEEKAVEKLKVYASKGHMQFDYTGSLGKSFEYAVLEYPFAFWQYHGECDSIPTGDSLDEYIAYLMKISSIYAFSDKGIKEFETHYYQAATQSGYYGYDIKPFASYLHHFNGANPSATFPPKGINVPAFDGSLNARVSDWLATDGNNIVYIYGGIDAWTAAGIIPSDKVNSKRFLVPGATHATARVKNMPPTMQQEYVEKVKQLSGLNADVSRLQ